MRRSKEEVTDETAVKVKGEPKQSVVNILESVQSFSVFLAVLPSCCVPYTTSIYHLVLLCLGDAYLVGVRVALAAMTAVLVQTTAAGDTLCVWDVVCCVGERSKFSGCVCA
ncbi:hypothetical protein BaRGS_00034773 [Batillaria attramentaria]|uniref:Uncharacterized protein n=1 Tax=Batillaria attramentaria TaxID=370345 RepID=A0ABD0JGG7_9CAEN